MSPHKEQLVINLERADTVERRETAEEFNEGFNHVEEVLEIPRDDPADRVIYVRHRATGICWKLAVAKEVRDAPLRIKLRADDKIKYIDKVQIQRVQKTIHEKTPTLVRRRFVKQVPVYIGLPPRP